VSDGAGFVIATTEGQKDDVRLQVGLVANIDGSVETFVTYVGVGTNVLVEGEGAMMVAQAVRVYNEAVETFAGQGFQGMEPIPVEYSLEIVEAVAYVRLTGEEPDLDDKFRLRSPSERSRVSADVTEAVRADLRGDAFKGFDGFVSFDALRNGALAEVPTSGGAYVVLRLSKDDPSFLDASCGGHFKGKDPTEVAHVLQAKWVSDTPVVYIGKGDNLQRRLKEYAEFGAGRPIGHWGGRYIWQLADRDQLVVAWKSCEQEQTAAALEKELLTAFKRANGGHLPFANIADPSRRKRRDARPTASSEE
jgi:hypothetical protein